MYVPLSLPPSLLPPCRRPSLPASPSLLLSGRFLCLCSHHASLTHAHNDTHEAVLTNKITKLSTAKSYPLSIKEYVYTIGPLFRANLAINCLLITVICTPTLHTHSHTVLVFQLYICTLIVPFLAILNLCIPVYNYTSFNSLLDFVNNGK